MLFKGKIMKINKTNNQMRKPVIVPFTVAIFITMCIISGCLSLFISFIDVT